MRLALIFRTHCFHGTCYYEDDAFIYGAGSIRAEDVAAKKFDAIVEKVGLSDAECRMHSVTELIETTELLDAYVAEFMRWEDLRHWKKQKNRGERK